MLDDLIKANQKINNGSLRNLEPINIPKSCVSNSAKDYVELALENSISHTILREGLKERLIDTGAFVTFNNHKELSIFLHNNY